MLDTNMSSIELQCVTPTVPAGPNGTLSLEQVTTTIKRIQRNESRIATMLRNMDIRVTDIERERIIG